MRPVVKPALPPATPSGVTYDQTTFGGNNLYQDYVDVVTFKGKKRTVNQVQVWFSVDEGVDELTGLFEDWTGDGAQVDPDGAIEWGTNAEEAKFTNIYGKLAKKSDLWGQARRQLIQALGPYCSYCGLRVDSNLHIEHVVAKKYYANRAFVWTNFLLACPTCNSCKGDNPPLQNVYGDMGVALDPMTQDTDYADAADWINGDPAQGLHYLWANVDWTTWIPLPGVGPASMFPLRVVLRRLESYRNTLSFGALLTPTEIARARQLYADGTLGFADGRWYLPGNNPRYKTYFGLKLEALPAAGGATAAELAVVNAATQLLDIANLNRIVKSSSVADSVDRRIELRTAAWFEASRALDDLAAAPPGLRPVIERHVTERIRATGAWIVWLSVLQAGGYPNAGAVVAGALTGTLARDWTL